MTPDVEKTYRTLARLCRAAESNHDPRTLFRQAAEAFHDLTGCASAALFAAPGGPLASPGLVLEFTDPPHCSELPGGAALPAAARGVIEQRRPRLVLHREGPDADDEAGPLTGYPAVLYLPLVCRGETLGVLGLAGRCEQDAARWDTQLLEAPAALLALALDGLSAHTRLADVQRLRQEVGYLRSEARTDRDLRPLTGDSPAMRAVRLAIQQVARTDSTVLILGETGTGKELVARAIHQLSPRRDHLLVAVNCAALAPGVIASELFGHEAGAFTGATRRRAGRFELAHRGTLFLDEVGELPPETQVLLLRTLQERVIERVGGGEAVPVDVRVIAATHRDLTAALGEGRFREDLFYRLNVFPIRVPPLRERREDIPDLVRHFLHHFGRRLNKFVTEVSPAALRLLTGYDWPGNVRELENIIERAMIVAAGDTLEVEPSWLGPAAAARAEAPPGLAELERRAILDALERSGGRVYGPGGAAAALGLKPTTLYGKMRKHGIERPTVR